MKNVLIILPKGFEMFEAAAFSDVFGWARDVGKQEVRTFLCGLESEVEPAFSNNNNPHIVRPNILIDEIHAADYDAIAIPGGFGKYGYYESGFDGRILKLIRSFDEQGKPIAAVCTAALVLGKSGILSGRTATTYNSDNGMYFRQLETFGVIASEKNLVVDENVITSSGPQSAPLVALKLLEMLTSKEIAGHIARVMGFEE